MYSEFDEISFFLAMSNSQIVSLEKDSKPIQSELLLRAASELPSSLLEIPAQKDRESKQKTETEEEGREGEESRILAPNEDGVKEEVAESSCVEEKESKKPVKEGADGDDGYHTPTSPRHRIPAVLQCPPAPRKVLPKRTPRRKAGDRELYRVVRRRLDLSGDVELILCPVLADPALSTIKKARGGDEVVG